MEINLNEIKELLPHRYPFLLIDKVTDFEYGKNLKAIKNVTCNEPYFNGHFPTENIMPGVLIIEALAQATGLLAIKTIKNNDPKFELNAKNIYMLVAVDKVRFKSIVRPGDQLILNVEVVTEKSGIWKFKCNAKVDDKIVTEAYLMCTQKK